LEGHAAPIFRNGLVRNRGVNLASGLHVFDHLSLKGLDFVLFGLQG
jgi:hypothetical protein